jgi:hypothetical protein
MDRIEGEAGGVDADHLRSSGQQGLTWSQRATIPFLQQPGDIGFGGKIGNTAERNAILFLIADVSAISTFEATWASSKNIS